MAVPSGGAGKVKEGPGGLAIPSGGVGKAELAPGGLVVPSGGRFGAEEASGGLGDPSWGWGGDHGCTTFGGPPHSLGGIVGGGPGAVSLWSPLPSQSDAVGGAPLAAQGLGDLEDPAELLVHGPEGTARARDHAQLERKGSHCNLMTASGMISKHLT